MGPPLLVPQTESALRTVRAVKTALVVDHYKMGVVYVGPGQTTEDAILSNTTGSEPYMNLLDSLGRLVRTKGCTEYALGGLNTETDYDGKWTYVWSNNVTQIAYHVATLMPNHPHDLPRMAKKAHIGNNYVTVREKLRPMSDADFSCTDRVQRVRYPVSFRYHPVAGQLHLHHCRARTICASSCSRHIGYHAFLQGLDAAQRRSTTSRSSRRVQDG